MGGIIGPDVPGAGGGSTEATLLLIKTAVEAIDHLIAANAGTADAGTQRMILASDDAVAAAAAAKEASTPTNVLAVGGQTVDGVPTELAADKLASAWLDTFRRVIVGGYDPANQSLDINDINPARAWRLIEDSWAALTTPADETPILDLRNYSRALVAYIISFGGVSDVDLIIWGSIDGTNWFILWSDNIATTDQNPDVVILTVVPPYLKCEFDGENGDTDATVTFQVMAGN